LPIHNGSAVKPATDNAAGAALLALLQLAAHPGDTLARGYLSLIDTSTAGPKLVKSATILRERLFSGSCENAVRWATEQIAGHLSDNDDWHRKRLQQLVDQAREFDSEPQRDIDSLIRFLHASNTGDSQVESAVIIETIHKSKGLEYDAVIFVNEDKTARSETDICPLQDETGQTEWILQPIRKELMQADPTLKQLLDQTTSQRDFGKLCALYVAMTRAKRGLYMISDLKSAHQASTVYFLKQVLGHESRTEFQFLNSKSKIACPVLWSAGDPNWHEAFEPPTTEPVSKVAPETTSFKPAHPRLQLARPSTLKARKVSAARYFELEQKATHFGTLVHNVFEQIEWFTELPQDMDENVRQTLQSCFDQPDIRNLFTKPAGQSTVWRERAFSYVDGDRFVNGVFDRVVIHMHNSKIVRAEIIDFKTDRIHSGNTLEQAIAHHRPQLETYRAALARITGIDSANIELKLLFTSVQKCVQL
jgi:ATP-dependent helicase/nuclease subunit A